MKIIFAFWVGIFLTVGLAMAPVPSVASQPLVFLCHYGALGNVFIELNARDGASHYSGKTERNSPFRLKKTADGYVGYEPETGQEYIFVIGERARVTVSDAEHKAIIPGVCHRQ
jgi:hypothetical protein